MPIGKLEPFNLNSKQWPAYIRRVNQYILLNDIKDDRKVPMLITVVGEATYSLMCDLCSPEFPEDKTYDALVKLVSEHLEPQRSEIAERHVFRLRRQHPGESLMEYLQALKHLATTCNFGKCKTCSSLEENLRDQFVSGLVSEAMRSRIFAEKKIQYKEAVELALALEAAEKHAEVSGTTGLRTSPVASGDAGEGVHYARRGGGRGPSSRGEQRAASSAPAQACWRCGKAHRPDRCRYMHYNCDQCNKKGHLKVMCKIVRGSGGQTDSRQNYVSSSVSENESDDMFNLDVGTKGNKPYFIKVVIDIEIKLL